MDLTLFSVAELLICQIWFYLLSIIEKTAKHLLCANQYAEIVTESKLLCLLQGESMNPRRGVEIRKGLYSGTG